jgi:hypothetical protein
MWWTVAKEAVLIWVYYFVADSLDGRRNHACFCKHKGSVKNREQSGHFNVAGSDMRFRHDRREISAADSLPLA